MKQTFPLLLLTVLLSSLLILVSCGELSTPGDPISINSSPPREAYLDEYYTNLIRVTGGLNSYTYKIDEGSLPPGLSLSGLGEIQGTPTTEGSYSFTITVTDANLSKTFANYTLNVRKAPPAQLRLNLPLTQMRESFVVRPEILDARALQGFRTKLSWDAARFTLVEDSLRSISDRVIMFEQLSEGNLQVDIAIKGEALTGNHRLFLFELEPATNSDTESNSGPDSTPASFISIQGTTEFVNQDGKRGFQQITEGQQNVDNQTQDLGNAPAENGQDTQNQADNQTQDNTSETEETENNDQNDSGNQ